MSGFDIVSKATSSVEVFTQDKNFLVSVKRLRHFMLKTLRSSRVYADCRYSTRVKCE